MTDYSKITALYSRLSVGDEDRDGGESNSIQNQKIFLENYARGQHLTNIRHYIDDDESGRFFDRSAYSRMMDDVENGKIGVCIMFIGLVRKYTRARKLTPRMLNELIEKIEVFNAEKIDGVWEQRLRIHYNCVGTIEIPTVLPLPIPEVSVNTRKGVVVNYAPCELAV